MSSGTKMKALLLLFFATAVSAEQFISVRLHDIAEKYRHQSLGNGEFSSWIEKVFYAARKPMGNRNEKDLILQDFLVYDTKRQYLEDKITERINEIESLLPNRKLSQICVTEYLAQKSRLNQAYKFSNYEKQRLIDKNSWKCTARDEPKYQPPPLPAPAPAPAPAPTPAPAPSTTEDDEDDYDYWYGWWWG